MLAPSPASFTTSPHGAFRPPFQPVENTDQIGHDRKDHGQKFNAHGLASSLFESAPPACGPHRGDYCLAAGFRESREHRATEPIYDISTAMEEMRISSLTHQRIRAKGISRKRLRRLGGHGS